jgi:pyrroloquinoline quinone biosynthesis protein B
VSLSADGRRWFLLNASPDLRQQIENFPLLAPPKGQPRGSAIEGIMLTDADLDHTLGLLTVREGLRRTIYATEVVRSTLTTGLNLLPTLNHYCAVVWQNPARELTPLLYADGTPSGLRYAAHVVAGHPPLYMGTQHKPKPGDRVGYQFVDDETGGCLFYFPGLSSLEPPVQRLLTQGDVLLLDGTFWSEDEMVNQGLSIRHASEMGHLPVGGENGSLSAIAGLSLQRKIYVHINNTNPMLIEGSQAHEAVIAAGCEVGHDGMHILL